MQTIIETSTRLQKMKNAKLHIEVLNHHVQILKEISEHWQSSETVYRLRVKRGGQVYEEILRRVVANWWI